MTADDIASLLSEQAFVREALRAVATVGIEDACIAAGFIRNAVWDYLHGYNIGPTVGSDVDVVFCDHSNATLQRDIDIEGRLVEILPDLPWSVHNQARMHARNCDPPYASVEQAIAHFLETPTAIGARLDHDQIKLIAPHGICDLVQLVVRPTPAGKRKIREYRARIKSKNWHLRWTRLRVLFE